MDIDNNYNNNDSDGNDSAIIIEDDDEDDLNPYFIDLNILKLEQLTSFKTSKLIKIQGENGIKLNKFNTIFNIMIIIIIW